MSIYVDKDTKVIVQGITDSAGMDNIDIKMKYGKNIDGEVTSGKSGKTTLGVPVFNTVEEAVNETGTTVSIIYVSDPFEADAIMEATDAGIELAICITEHIPVIDMIK